MGCRWRPRSRRVPTASHDSDRPPPGCRLACPRFSPACWAILPVYGVTAYSPPMRVEFLPLCSWVRVVGEARSVKPIMVYSCDRVSHICGGSFAVHMAAENALVFRAAGEHFLAQMLSFERSGLNALRCIARELASRGAVGRRQTDACHSISPRSRATWSGVGSACAGSDIATMMAATKDLICIPFFCRRPARLLATRLPALKSAMGF